MTSLPALAGAEGATVREYRKAFRTYPFSDPDPIPNAGRIYPYFRFDGFTERAEEREWTVVELENPWIQVTVLPEVGGKVWSAVEKSTGKSFLYGNQVVKFRDVAMRGPWTSGGIEANYGIIGHTPNCATPVDYLTRQNPDGSASVVIGVLDLLTRTPWRLEVTVPADKAYFTTTSLWHNATPLEQPYYTWMNAGIKAAGNLELVYPGTHYIGHGGEASPWPIDAKGRDLSFYEKNDFGPSKSYHVLGRMADFFAAFWHDDDFGMGRYSPRDEKLGKKIWIWGLSRQGMIWEKLLTDTDGQYVEVQSGRSFNQAAEASSETPFKHRGFLPYGTDTWTEYWFPVKGTKGLVAASPLGGLNVRPRDGGLDVLFSPLEAVDDTLEVLDGDRVVFSTPGLGEAPRDVDDGRPRGRAGRAPARPDRREPAGVERRPEGGGALAPDGVARRFRLGLRLRALAEGQGAAPPALLRSRPRGARGVPPQGPALRARPRRPGASPLPGDGLRRSLRPGAEGPRHRHLRPVRELLLRPRRAEARPAGRRAGRLRAGRAVRRAARRRVDGAREAGLPRGRPRAGRVRRGAEPRLQPEQPRGAPAPGPRPPGTGPPGGVRRRPRRDPRPGSAQPLRPLREGPPRG